MNPPLSLDIAICTYNNAPTLDRALEAIEAQSVSPELSWAVVVVDNNCTDDTAAVVDRYMQRGHIPGLRRVVESQQGLAHARRRAVMETEAELIGFVDDDCLLSSAWVQQAVDFCRAHPAAGVVGSQVSLVWEVPPEPVLLEHAMCYAQQEYGDQPLSWPHERMPQLVGAGLVVKREALLASGWLEQTLLVDRRGKALSGGGDIEIGWRILHAGYELWYNPAMGLDHWIARHRSTESYLRKLCRGSAQAWPVIKMLQEKATPSLGWRIRLCGRSVWRLLEVSIEDIIPHLLGYRPASDAERIRWLGYFGRVGAAFRFLLDSRSLPM